METEAPPRPVPVSRPPGVYRSTHARKGRKAWTVVWVSLCLVAAAAVVALVPLARPDDRPDHRPATSAGSAAAATVAPATTPPAGRRPANQPRRKPSSSAELPAGGPVPATGAGRWHVVPGRSGVAGTGIVRTYTVEVEDGITLPDGEAAFGAAVQATLADPRSWIGTGDIAVRRIDSGRPDVHVRISSQRTTRARCGFSLKVDVSCRDGDNVYLNSARWIRGAVAFGDDLAGYRRYLVNHEVGHFFGRMHQPCKVHGGPAPVMMQQTLSTSNNEIADITALSPQGVVIPRNGRVCKPNPWPFP